MFLSVDEPPLGDANLEHFDGLPTSPTPQAACLDVNVVPEHEKGELLSSVSHLQGQISELKSRQRYLDGKRREALNRMLDIKGSIRVFCRVRPPIPATMTAANSCVVTTGSEKVALRLAGPRKEFRLDRVFPPETAQEDVFAEVGPFLRSALDGHNVCIFAYGQTGTGKTYTMEGTAYQPGIVPRAIRELFRQASMDIGASFTFSMSMLEIYMGSLRDLLAQRVSAARTADLLTRSLNIQTGGNGCVEVEGLTKVELGDFKQASRWYAKGKRARTTSWTNVNEASSRSHCLTRITIGRTGNDGKAEVISKLWMVDLGGSERLLKTGATGQTMDEGKAINLSLSALADVISALKRRRNHVPYRNTKLTQILKDSLGDGSKVLMLVHISTSENDIGETICSLNFARRARAIELSEEVSEELRSHGEKCIVELYQQIKDAEEELQKVGNGVQKAEHCLQEKKKLLLMGYHLDNPKGSPRSPLIIGCRDISESPHTNDKGVCKTRSSSLPRFMASTACSRQRQNAVAELSRQNAVAELSTRIRASRLGNTSTIDMFGSQSCSFVDPYARVNPHSSKTRLVKLETNKSRFKNLAPLFGHENLSCSSVDSKPSTTPRTRSSRVSASHPNMRTQMCQHRRRMSDIT